MIISYLKNIIKNVISFALYYSGVLFFMKYIKLQNRVIILTYHRVLPYQERNNSFSHPAIMIDRNRFDRNLKFLKRHFNIITNKELIECFKMKRFSKKYPCIIAFDDGWLDNYLYAFPVLKSNKVPAIIFTATDYIGANKLFWQEAMGHGFFKLLDNPTKEAMELLIEHNLDALLEQPKSIQVNKIIQYVRELKALEYKDIEETFNRINNVLGEIQYGNTDCYLNWEQIKEMHDNGVEFGSHACSHRILTRLDDMVVTDELQRSRKLLSASTGETIDTIAYPNGNYNDNLGVLVAEAGYALGYGTQFGTISLYDNPFNLKRINLNDVTSKNSPFLLATILGVF